MSAHGQITMETPIATGIVQVDTYQKVAGTTVLDDANEMDMPVTGRLRHIGTVARPIAFGAAVTVEVVSVATITLAFAYGGVVDEDTEIEFYVPETEIAAFGLNDIATLDEDEYVELWVKADDTVNITITKMSLIAAAK